MAFKRIDNSLGFLRSPFCGFENFVFLFKGDAFRITKNTLGYNFVFIFLGLAVSVIIAIALNEIWHKNLLKIYQTIIILPFFLSFVVSGYIVYAFLSMDNGFVNNVLLPKLGLEAVNWYLESKYWFFILTFVNLWVYCGIASIIYFASIVAIDHLLYESAIVDGANKWQQIIYITIPMLLPIMMILTILNLGNIFRGNFGLFFQVPLAAAPLLPATDVIDTYVYRALVTMQDFGMSTAASLYQSVVGCVYCWYPQT